MVTAEAIIPKRDSPKYAVLSPSSTGEMVAMSSTTAAQKRPRAGVLRCEPSIWPLTVEHLDLWGERAH